MSQWLFDAFAAPLREPFFVKALVGGSIVALVCGVVGCLVILRRMAFLGDALSHAMIAGIGAGYLLMKVAFGLEANAPGMLVGSLIAAILTVTLIGFVSRVSRIKEDTAIGIMYCGIFAAGVVLISIFRNLIHIDLMHFIMGDVLGVADDDLWASAFVAATVLTAIVLFFRQFQLTSFDPVMAASIGMNVLVIDYLLTTCVSLVVVTAVSMVGVILVVGLLITPAASAYLLSDRLGRMMALGGLFGVTSVVGGLFLCYWLDSAGGGAIMLFCTLQFLVVLFVAPRYGMLAGWMRRRRMVPQQLFEDVLGSVLRADDGLAVQRLAEVVGTDQRRLRRAVASMTGDGLLDREGDVLRLTGEGRRQAESMRRSHRLWEAYLAHVGTPAAEVHAQAEQLEHLHANGAVEYLDHELGHPVHDPHGAEIPADPSQTPAGQVVQLSLLREDREATIVAVEADDVELEAGERIRIGPRREGDTIWVAVRTDGSEVSLDHASADAVMVRPEG